LPVCGKLTIQRLLCNSPTHRQYTDFEPSKVQAGDEKMQRSDIKDVTSANKAAWDASAPLHGAGPGWETLLASASQPGFSVLDPCLTETLQGIGIVGRRAVQVGCNNARELLSLAAFGAEPVLGIDQSAGFLAQGEQLARAAQLNPRRWKQIYMICL
jgi:hypothetical protein